MFYGLDEVMTNARRIVIFDNALPRGTELDHGERREESRSNKRESESKKSDEG